MNNIPFLLSPAGKDYLWGGERLKTEYGKQLPLYPMAEKYDLPILYSCHPRSRKRLEESGFPLDKRVIRHEPMGFHDYNCLQMNAFAVISDTGIPVPDYMDENVSDKVVRIMQSYTGVVNKMVWR